MYFNIFNSVKEVAKNDMTFFLLILIAFDLVTGVAKAIQWKVADSWVGWKGYIKHTLTFVFYFSISVLFKYVGMNPMGNIFMLYISFNYAQSILENLGVMGIKTPKYLDNKIKEEIKRYEEKIDK